MHSESIQLSRLVLERVLLVSHSAVHELCPGADAVPAGRVHPAHGGREAGRAVRARQRRPARGVPVRKRGRVRGDVVQVVARTRRCGGLQLRQHVRQARREGVAGAVRRAVAEHRARRRGAARGSSEQRDDGKEERGPCRHW
jgi:hypothetical protein